MSIRLLLLFLAMSGAIAAERDPKPAHERVFTATMAWWNAQLIDAYRAVGDHGHWDAAVERFLTNLAAQTLGSYPNPSRSEVASLGMDALNAGCRDALVVARTAMLYGDDDYGRSLVNWGADLLRQRQGTPRAYPPQHLVAMLRRQARYPDQAKAARARQELPGLVREVLRRATTDPARSGTADVLAYVVDPELVGDEVAAAMRDVLAEPATDPWLAKVLLGQAGIGLAWRSRGSGLAKDVTPEGWRGFETHLAEARVQLTSAWKLRPDLAAAPALMVTVAMGDRKDNPQDWAERALSIDPEDRETYNRLANAALPRWGGSHDAMLAFATRAAAGPTDGPLPGIAESLVAAVVTDRADQAAWQDPRLWPILQAATTPARDAPAEIQARLRTRRIAWAWHCGRHDLALDEFTAAGGMEAPWLEPGAVPAWTGQEAGPGLALAIRRELGHLPPAKLRALPKTRSGHLDREHRERSFCAAMPALYAAHGIHGAWDAAAKLLLGPVATRRWLEPDGPEPAWRSPEASLADCRDPLVRWCVHAMAAPGDDRDRLLEADWQALEASPYPALAAYQPAWELMRRPAEARQRLLPRYAETIALTARQAGTSSPLPVSMRELIQLPDTSEPVLAATEAAAAAAAPALADALRGIVDVQRGLQTRAGDPRRRSLGWRAIGRLWSAWDASHDPVIAADLVLATGLAGCPDAEIISWFDLAVEGAIERAEPYDSLVTALAINGRPDSLLMVAGGIAQAPPEAGIRRRVLPFLLSVISNPSLQQRPRMQRLWRIADPVSAGILGEPGLAADERRKVLHIRAACAFLAGNSAEAAAARQQLGTDFAPDQLPRGIDQAHFQREIPAGDAEPSAPEGKPAPSGF